MTTENFETEHQEYKVICSKPGFESIVYKGTSLKDAINYMEITPLSLEPRMFSRTIRRSPWESEG